MTGGVVIFINISHASHHMYPQLLHLNVFPNFFENNPKRMIDVPLLIALIFCTSQEPQVGQ